jgi:hypothetical protein
MRVQRRVRRGIAVAVVGLAALAVMPASALALTSAPDSTTWGTTGKVFALAKNGNTLFVGGTFKKMISPDGTQKFSKMKNLAAVDMTTGAPITTWQPIVEELGTTKAPTIRSLAVSPDGSTLYVGGRFDTINGVAVDNFAALSTDTGAVVVNPTFSPNVNKMVEAIVVGTDKVFIGGSFKKVNNQDRLRLAAINFDGTLNAWAPMANAVVRSMAMAPDGNTLFVGGLFSTINGVSRQSLARVNLTTGALDLWAVPFNTINNPQTAWTIVPRGNRVYVGFGHGPNFAAAFRLDNGIIGSQVWRWDAVGNIESLALNSAGTQLFASGHFGTAALQQHVCGSTPWLRGMVSLSLSNGQPVCSPFWLPQMEPHGANFTGGWCMLLTDTQLWVGGAFTSISGVPVTNLARFTL